jgi:outer membrane receptor protein involved in Fe transport
MLVGVSLFAATTGKIAGRVKDDKGNPVPYARVMIKGTQFGTQSDEQGKFMIINVAPGTYTLVCTAMSYATIEMTGVVIRVDDMKTVNFTLQKSTIKLKGMVVKDKQALVSKGTGSDRQLSSEQLENQVASNLDDVIAVQAGVVQKDGELHVRGGRPNEVNFTVDGMSVSDPVDGGTPLKVDMDAVQDMKVMVGAFTAEYGNAQSGVVNIVTKDGSENYEGKLEFTTDHLINDGKNSDEVKFALGGPVVPFMGSLRKNLTFFLNGSAVWDDSRYQKYYKNNPNEDLRYISNIEYPTYDPYEDRGDFLGFDIGNRNNNTYSINLKTKYSFSASQNLTLAVRGDRSFNHYFSHQWKYALQHYREDTQNQKQFMLTYDNTINTKSNIKVKLSYYEKQSKIYPRGIDKNNYIVMDMSLYNPETANFGYRTLDENADGVYDYGFADGSEWQYTIDNLEDPLSIPNFNAPGTIWANFIDDNTKAVNFRTDYEYQLNEIVGFKSGFEAIKYTIKKNQLTGFLSKNTKRFDDYLNTCTPDTVFVNQDGQTIKYYTAEDYTAAAKASYGTRDGYKAEPWQFAYYLQDKMEWEGMIVNLGVRFDFWYLGNEYKILTDNNTYRVKKFDSDDRFQMMVSPRLGISHPISERDVVHFAYNYQNQLPPMQYVFTSKDTLDAYGSGSVVTVGNPTLEPQITITYEVGLGHQMSEDYSLDVTAYYKNIYNYVSTKKVLSTTEASVAWYNYISQDYGSTRGIDFSLSRRLVNFISGNASYTLAWAKGNNSSTVIQDENTNLREFPLDWDTRHNFNLSLTFRIGKDEEFIVPFTSYILPFDDFSATIGYNIASGAPYTPIDPVTDVVYDTNSKRQDYTSTADLKLTKTVKTGGKTSLRFSFTVENLFKKNNINSVYAKTGSPYYDGADLENDELGYTFPETQYIHDQYTKDPSNYNNERYFIFGVSYNF